MIDARPRLAVALSRSPALPLEALGLGETPGASVLSTGGHDPRVLMGNRAACALGITPGMRTGAAHALGSIEVHTRCESAERAALHALAAWCGQFTSFVSLASPDGLLLEVGKSLSLFGGIEAIRRAIRTGVAALGYQPILAIAPTPLGAIFSCGPVKKAALPISDSSVALSAACHSRSWASMRVSRRPWSGSDYEISVIACACRVTAWPAASARMSCHDSTGPWVGSRTRVSPSSRRHASSGY